MKEYLSRLNPFRAKTKEEAEKKPKRQESTRDTIESILFAFILAFMFRTFEAEAFVIPTGSMAPTLYGRHKETDCAKCGYHVTVGASDEVDRDTNLISPHARIQSAICPNCGYENDQIEEALAFNGDRILVNKFPYEFGEPDRWDVFVFKNPQEPETNYIKRLVGLPNETLRISGGNVYLVTDSGLQILRKDPSKQRVLQIPVYDDKFPPREILEAGWPERWQSMKRGQIGQFGGWSDSKAGWEADDENRSYSIASDSGNLEWLRYRHFLPTEDDWYQLRKNQPLNPKARLISDFCAYNTYTGSEFSQAYQVDTGKFWARDLTINFDLELEAVTDSGQIVIELCEGVAWYRCEINPQTGEAVLSEINYQLNERREELATGQTLIRGPGNYSISFANVDDRLCLWVNNSLVDFEEGANLDNVAGATTNPLPIEQDLTPVGIAVAGVTANVSKLLLQRDIYYRAEFLDHRNDRFEHRLTSLSDDPEAWADFYNEEADELDSLEIEIGPDQFVALGDNSPRSLDSRLWGDGQQTVPRKFLVGKAFYIYWPHGVPFMNGGQGYPVAYHKYTDGKTHKGDKENPDLAYPRYAIPFYPQFWRMHRIR